MNRISRCFLAAMILCAVSLDTSMGDFFLMGFVIATLLFIFAEEFKDE